VSLAVERGVVWFHLPSYLALKTLDNNDHNPGVAKIRWSATGYNNSLLRVLILAGSEKLVLPIVM